MSLHAIQWVWQIPSELLCSQERLIMLYLADRADESGGSCYPGQSSIAKKSCLGERMVRKYLTSLERKGFITRSKRYNQHGERTSDSYQLPLNTDYRNCGSGTTGTVVPKSWNCGSGEPPGNRQGNRQDGESSTEGSHHASMDGDGSRGVEGEMEMEENKMIDVSTRTGGSTNTLPFSGFPVKPTNGTYLSSEIAQYLEREGRPIGPIHDTQDQFQRIAEAAAYEMEGEAGPAQRTQVGLQLLREAFLLFDGEDPGKRRERYWRRTLINQGLVEGVRWLMTAIVNGAGIPEEYESDPGAEAKYANKAFRNQRKGGAHNGQLQAG